VTIKKKTFVKQAKAIIEMLLTFIFVEIQEVKSPYNPLFVEKIKKFAASKNRTEVNPKDVWGTLGLS